MQLKSKPDHTLPDVDLTLMPLIDDIRDPKAHRPGEPGSVH